MKKIAFLFTLLAMCLCSCGNSIVNRVYKELEKVINKVELYQNTARFTYTLKSADIEQTGGDDKGELLIFACHCKVENKSEYFRDNLVLTYIVNEEHIAYYLKPQDKIVVD